MSVTITVPQDYGYVIATTAFTFFLGIWHGARARLYRDRAGVKQPKAYAESTDIAAADEEQKRALYLFNCAQRSHANYGENQPSTAMALLIAGLRYPRATILLGWAWIIGRIIFSLGYTRKDKEHGSGRFTGVALAWPVQFILWGLAGFTGFSLAQES